MRSQQGLSTRDKLYHNRTSSFSAGNDILFNIIYKRILAAVPLLLILSLVAFSIIKSLPGDPIDVMLGTAQRDVSPATIAELKAELGLDKSFVEQYLRWLWHVGAQADFGRSYKDGRPVAEVIGERLPATLALVLTSLVISFVIGTIWGLLMVWLRNRSKQNILENLLFSFSIILYSSPNFWVGLLIIAALANSRQFAGFSLLGLHDPGVPASFGSTIRHIVIPAIVLSTRRTAKIALFVRASTLDELNREYVLTARSKGLSRTAVLLKHVARNSLLPVATLVGLSLPALLGGSVLIETVFAWPGMGRLAVESTFARNYSVMLALIMLYGLLVILSSLIADIIQTCLDPRLSSAPDSPGAQGVASA
jgi:peptide/nickel transport system permease protein